MCANRQNAILPISWRRILFHPITVVTSSSFSATLLALLITNYSEGEVRSFLLYYYLPISIPFVAYLFDRGANWSESNFIGQSIDLLVLGLSIGRAFVAIPFISGHALFLSYALLSTRTWVARILALLVLIEVAYLKIFVWQDMTLLGGIGLGSVAALCFHRARLGKSGSRHIE